MAAARPLAPTDVARTTGSASGPPPQRDASIGQISELDLPTCNDDTWQGEDESSLQSRVRFAAEADTTYYVMVGS